MAPDSTLNTIFDNTYTIVYNINMLIKLGTELSKAREHMGVSLQAIADNAKISAAYIQKLERGEVTTPSPRVLRRLASSLSLPYLELMKLAGYLDKEELAEAHLFEPSPRPHPLASQKLTVKGVRAILRKWELREGKVLVVEDASTASLVVVARDLKDRDDKIAVLEEVIRKLRT